MSLRFFENENFGARPLGGACANKFFFLQMVSEQVNPIHETPVYGKI